MSSSESEEAITDDEPQEFIDRRKCPKCGARRVVICKKRTLPRLVSLREEESKKVYMAFCIPCTYKGEKIE